MIAARIAAGRLDLVELPAPMPRAGEALIRVILAGVCATDLELVRGYMGFEGTPGHEFVGEVVSSPLAPELEGARVVGEINAGCAACAYCREGLERHCPKRTVLGILGRSGAFAELLALPVRNLHRVPPELSLARAVFVEPVAAAFEIPEQVPVEGRRVLVMGDGKLGTLAARVLDLAGAEVTVLGRHRRKLEPLAADGFTTYELGRDSPPPPRSFALVVEATGGAKGLEQALGFVRPRGTVVLKTTCAEPVPIQLAPVVVDEVTVVGSRCGPFDPAIRALASGALRPEESIDGMLPLGEIGRAFELAAAPQARKIIVEMPRS